MTDILHKICSDIWETWETPYIYFFPDIWKKIINHNPTEKGNIRNCSNYLTISLISHASKVMLKIIKNRLQLQADRIIAEEQTGFMKRQINDKTNIHPKNIMRETKKKTM